jgi:acyl carrier protein
MERNVSMSPGEKRLFDVLTDVLLIDEEHYLDDFGPDEIDTWDSLATVSIAAALAREFGFTMPPEQMASIETIGDIKSALRSGGVELDP